MKQNEHFRGLLTAAAVVAGLALVAPLQAQQTGRSERPRAGQQDRMGGQQRLDPQQRLERRVSMLTERLSLSESQVTKVRRILQREQEQMAQLFDQAGFGQGRAWGGQGGAWGNQGQRGERPDGAAAGQRRARPDSVQMQQFRTRAQAIRAQTQQELAKVLTREQLEKYQALRPEGTRNAWGERRGGARERGADFGGKAGGSRN